MAEKTIVIPEGVEVKIEGNTLVVKGPKGELSREFKHSDIKKQIKEGKIALSSGTDRRKLNALLGTWVSHIRNMITGVTSGWEAKLKIVYSHFPIKVSVEGDRVVIGNFMGRKSNITSKIAGDVKVEVKKDEIIVSGIDKGLVGQTAANIEIATKVTGYDRRVFQDGCHLIEKCRPAGEGD